MSDLTSLPVPSKSFQRINLTKTVSILIKIKAQSFVKDFTDLTIQESKL